MKVTNPVKASDSTQLSAPWDILFNKITATIGADPAIKTKMISESDSSKTIKIMVPDLSQAQCIATLLIPQYTFGEVTVNVKVHFDADTDGDCDTSVSPIIVPSAVPVNVAGLVVLERALHANPFFYIAFPPCMLEDTDTSLKNKLQEKCKNNTGILPWDASLVVVFRKIVVNYYSDNISDFFLSTNEVPSVAFSSIMHNVIFDKCTFTFTELPKIGIDNE